MFEFTKIIREIDAELKPEFQSGAFKWADLNMGNLHSDAVERFDRAITSCTERSDWVSLRLEAEMYKSAMLKILRAFKSYKSIDEKTSFLDSIKGA